MRPAIIKSFILLLTLMAWNCSSEKTTRVYGPIPEDTEKKITEINFKKDTNKPRIAIVSHYTLDKESLGFIDLGTKNHQKYARLHGYDYYYRNGTITKKYFWPQGHNRTFQLGLYWQKIEATKQLLDMKENGKNIYDYVMWIDTDAFFTNIYLALEDIINSAPEDTFFIATDDPKARIKSAAHSCINSGVYILKNTYEGRNFINVVDAAFDLYKSVQWPEQLAMADFVFGHLSQQKVDELNKNPDKKSDFIESILWRNCSIRHIPGVHVLNMREINGAYPWADVEQYSWNEHSLVAHFLGLTGPQVERYARVLLECLEQSNYRNRAQCNAHNLNIILR